MWYQYLLRCINKQLYHLYVFVTIIGTLKINGSSIVGTLNANNLQTPLKNISPSSTGININNILAIEDPNINGNNNIFNNNNYDNMIEIKMKHMMNC